MKKYLLIFFVTSKVFVNLNFPQCHKFHANQMMYPNKNKTFTALFFFYCNEFLIKTFSISIFGMCKLKGLVNDFPMLFIMNIAEILQNGYIKMLQNLILTGNIKSYMLVLYRSSLYIHCRHRKSFQNV